MSFTSAWRPQRTDIECLIAFSTKDFWSLFKPLVFAAPYSLVSSSSDSPSKSMSANSVFMPTGDPDFFSATPNSISNRFCRASKRAASSCVIEQCLIIFPKSSSNETTIFLGFPENIETMEPFVFFVPV